MYVCAHTWRPEVSLSCFSFVHLSFEAEFLTGTWDPLIRVGPSREAPGLCLSVSPERGILVLAPLSLFPRVLGMAHRSSGLQDEHFSLVVFSSPIVLPCSPPPPASPAWTLPPSQPSANVLGFHPSLSLGLSWKILPPGNPILTREGPSPLPE